MKKKITVLILAAVCFLSGFGVWAPAATADTSGAAAIRVQTTIDDKAVTLAMDGDGCIDISNVPNGPYKFTFSADDYAPLTCDVTVSNGSASGLKSSIELHLFGDLNADGKLNMQDVGKANAHVKNTARLTDAYDQSVCDVNSDGKVNMQDVGLMNAHAKNTKSLWSTAAGKVPKLTTQITTSSGSKVDFPHLADQLSYPDLKVTKRIKWMAWWTMDETSGEAVLFKEAYGIPATGDNPADDGRIFENTIVDYAARYDRLSTSIASDESPDLFPFEITDFPYGILMNRYQAVDDIVDFNSEKWQPTKALNDQFMLNGKHYTAFWTYGLADMMWYKKSNVEAIGKDDPQELFKQGKWDWDAFLDIARAWQQSGSTDTPRFVTDGWSVEENIVTATGVPIIGTDGSKLVRTSVLRSLRER